ncbi:MAG: biosynthetic peptidoglycan transglycosylase [Sediminibacterium sp.]|uniref:biosynthetic peptidoglycan transglycosylase n=1 Tax=Sediminibacterium sp. TaxID=1917865 RepID=UPI002725EE8E|nr:biosynthetic peptidoglycan transglycosylase [Sediminibacterium sp.]MDO8997836.1 biosynthetic peptidoglycan transglycosylase [Sediminibacterium sp.]
MMRYFKCLLYFFLLLFLTILKNGKGIRKIEQYLIDKINNQGIFHLNVSSIEYLFPTKFVLDILQVNKINSFSIELKEFTIKISSPFSLQFYTQQINIYNNGSLDISLQDCSCRISVIPSLVGIKVKIRNEIGIKKFIIETLIARNFIAKTVAININTGGIAIQQILSIFQRLSFPKLKNIKISGRKTFQLQFVYASNKPMNYSFKYNETGVYEVISKNIHEFNYLQNNKAHTIIDNNNNIKTFLFNEMDEEFISIVDIPDIVLKTIITTEDPNFLFHNGFDIDCFGFALATNIDTRRLARGGSTITMQLIRNLYLDNSKTFSRKMEEIILTWIIEDQLHVPKDKILELYFNRIEMGPALYGIKNAAMFYFNKRVEDLTLLDSLVLSYIIPRPKFFLPALISQSQILKKNLKLHLKKYALIMSQRELITKDEHKKIQYTIQFSKTLGKLEL